MVMPELLHRDPSDCSFPIYIVGFGFPDGLVVKTHLPVQEMQDTWVRSLGLKDTQRSKWQPTPVFLPVSMDRAAWQATVNGDAKSRHE